MAAGTDISCEVLLERGAEFRQVQVAVDAAELVIGFEHPGRAPALSPSILLIPKSAPLVHSRAFGRWYNVDHGR